MGTQKQGDLKKVDVLWSWKHKRPNGEMCVKRGMETEDFSTKFGSGSAAKKCLTLTFLSLLIWNCKDLRVLESPIYAPQFRWLHEQTVTVHFASHISYNTITRRTTLHSPRLVKVELVTTDIHTVRALSSMVGTKSTAIAFRTIPVTSSWKSD
jgi:hypothetical protein